MLVSRSARGDRAVALLALLASAAVSCGTTVPAGEVRAGSSGLATSNGDLGGPAGGSPVEQPGAGATGGAVAPPGPVTATASASSPGTASTGADGSLSSAAKSGHGPVELGVEYFDSAAVESEAKTFGYSANPGDPYAEAQALVAWLNKHGGLAGHPVVPVYEQYPIGGDPTTFEQSACQAWTQDHHVVAVVYPQNFSGSGVLPACLAKAGVMLTGGADTYLNSSQLIAAGGFLDTPYMFAGDRWAGLLVDRLVAQHWFATGARIGLISIDGSTYATDATLITRRLANYGLSVIDHAAIADAQPQQDTQDCQNVGLRFAADHISNVIVDDEGAVVELYCAPVFRTQQYYPKLSISSYDSPSTVQSIVPANQLAGSAGIGWEPVNDVANPTLNTAGKRCIDIMRSAGQDVTASAIEEAIAAAYCDGFFFLRQAFAAAGSLSAAAVQQAIARLAGSYTSPATMAVRFAQGRYDGVAAVSDLSYQTSCSCYRYQGQPVSAP